ncbi:hypothetical protein [Pseudokineococcus sp. 1T1Z-3]|uniref:hypothetical protein n=1 Tax=Pseudokineococcus sp. 1T1Z-3 TaxID=3132745 RepID=UPI0030A240E9
MSSTSTDGGSAATVREQGRPAPARLRRLVRTGRSASGAVVAQLAQAAASLVLQVVALRALGAEGLAVFALVYSGLVLVTALSSGLVGDSLTVLDRRDPRVRSGLLVVALVVAVGSAALTVLVVRPAGLLEPGPAIVAAAAVLLFLLEDLGRRWLMAALLFWRVVAVDAASLVVAVAWLVVRSEDLVMADLFAALALGQLSGLLVALLCLPRHERSGPLAWRTADVAGVLRFGAWRAAQQAVRPGTLMLVRVLVVAALGTAAVGQLEAARLYAAPAMLVLAGAASFLFASYASRRSVGLDRLLAAADRGAAALVLSALGAGAVAVLLVPSVGPLLTASQFSLDVAAVAGWCLYAAASASLTPYASLAAVRGRHVAVLVLRLGEMLLTLGAVAVLLFAVGVGAAWMPLALVGGAVGSAVVARQRLLLPLVAAQRREAAEQTSRGAVG